MTNWFLKAKHWQLFLLTFGLPFIFQIISMVSMVTSSLSRGESEVEPAFAFSYIMPFFIIMIFILMFGLMGWMWSMTTGLQKMLPDQVSMNQRLFKIFFFIPVVYLFVFIGFFFWSFQSAFADPNFNPENIATGFAIIFPIHLFSMFCLFYVLYFTAKTIKTVELQRDVTFGDFAGEFFLLWFYPIGVWLIQPRINKLVEN